MTVAVGTPMAPVRLKEEHLLLPKSPQMSVANCVCPLFNLDYGAVVRLLVDGDELINHSVRLPRMRYYYPHPLHCK